MLNTYNYVYIFMHWNDWLNSYLRYYAKGKIFRKEFKKDIDSL